MLNGIEEDFNQGFSIFYHNCSEREEINPLVTIIKLIKIIEAVYRIAKSGKTNESETSIMALIFGSRKKTSRYGIIPQLLYISSLELINSRVEYLSSDDCDLDQVIGVTFGFHLLQSMSRNIYAESKRYLHDRPLEFNTMCVKRNCHHKNHKPIPCVRCGLRFHPNCFKVSTTPNFVGELQKHCPSCGASEMLMNDARLNNLSNIYSLIFTLVRFRALVFICISSLITFSLFLWCVQGSFASPTATVFWIKLWL